MAKMGRPGIPDSGKQELWDRWRAGESISQIAVALSKPPGSVFTVLRHYGGIAPKKRTRRPGYLTLAEREEISRALACGHSLRPVTPRNKRNPPGTSPGGHTQGQNHQTGRLDQADHSGHQNPSA